MHKNALVAPLAVAFLASASAQPLPAAPKTAATARSSFVPSVLCLPLPSLPPGARAALGSDAAESEVVTADLFDLDGDGTRDRFVRRSCDGRNNCMYSIFVRRGGCGYYVGGLFSEADELKLLPGKHQGLRDLAGTGCYRGGCESSLGRYNGHSYEEAEEAQRPSARPLRVFPGAGIEQVALGMAGAELVKQGFISVGSSVLRQGPLEVRLAADQRVESIVYRQTERQPIDVITTSGGIVRRGEMDFRRIEELAEELGTCGPLDGRAAAGPTIFCAGGASLRSEGSTLVIEMSKQSPAPKQTCSSYPGRGRSNALFPWTLVRGTSYCAGALRLTRETTVAQALAAGCQADSPTGATSGVPTLLRCGSLQLSFAADGLKQLSLPLQR